ncbi:hypothetical protein SAMN05878482_101667 [Peribacillus simplex]|uniref:O-antigen ligase family protein n=1 Tax=Peribacillus simplex TaxID=1478 RepID=A0A9X8WHQ2_9BACI|nr:hypothetical protein [Peribacillus simplex]SIQ21788.1 hypothetical protein SAMN05878482_101667 [Peribacillus simplex]
MNKLIYLIFLLGVFFSPFTTFLPLGFNVSMYDIILISCFGLIIVTTAIQFEGYNKILSSKEYFLLILFVLGGSISAFNAASFFGSTLIMVQYLFAILIQIIVISHILTYSKNIDKNLFGILDTSIYALMVTLSIGVLAQLGLLPNSSEFFAGNGRLISVQGNANSLAKYLVCFLPILLFYIDIKRKTLLSFFLLAMLIINLFLTASFGGMAYALATFIYYYMIKSLFITKPIRFKNGEVFIVKKILNVRNVFIIFFSVAIVIYVFVNPPEIFSKRVLATDDLDGAGSYSLKVSLMKEALELIVTKYGIIGMGLGSYPFESQYHTNVHNLYLLVFTESGVLGFVGLIGLLIYTFCISLRLIKHVGNTTKYILIGMNSSLFGLLVSVITTPHTYSRSTWLLVILLLCYTKHIQRKNFNF